MVGAEDLVEKVNNGQIDFDRCTSLRQLLVKVFFCHRGETILVAIVTYLLVM